MTNDCNSQKTLKIDIAKANDTLRNKCKTIFTEKSSKIRKQSDSSNN